MLAPLASGRAVPLPYRALRASVARWSRIRAKVSPKISPRTSSLSRNERWKPGRKPDAASSRSTCAASSSNSRQPRLTPSWEASRAPITGTTTQPWSCPRTQLMATCAGGRPISAATATTSAVAARYLPVSDPPSSRPQGVTARFSAAAIGRCSCSTSRSASDHGICTATGGVQPRSSATARPRLTTHAGVSEKPTWSTLPARTWSSTAHDLLDRGRLVPHVQPQQVDAVGAEPAQARLQRADQALAVVAPGVGVVAPAGQRVLGGDHPAVPVGGDHLADDALAGAVGVVAGGVDEVAAGLAVAVEHAPALGGARAPAPVLPEGHRAERQLGHAQPASAQQPVQHRLLLPQPPARNPASRACSSRGASARRP